MIGHLGNLPFILPPSFVTIRQAIIAVTGGGKSYAAQVQAEELLKANQQIIAIDYTGVWRGLQSSADGARPGFKILVAGGDHGDIPLEHTAGKVMARAIVEEGFSCVLDLSLFEDKPLLIFVGDFLHELFLRNRQPLHIFADEADVYAPQIVATKEQTRTLAAMNHIMRRGRVKGIGMTVITQRPQEISKSMLTQCALLSVLRVTSATDIKPVKTWIEAHGDQFKAKQLIASLPSLPRGEVWMWAPAWPTASGIFGKLALRPKETFDSGKTPEAGERVAEPRVLARLDLGKLGAAIQSTVEKLKAEDPALLRARIVELEAQIKAAPRERTITIEKRVPFIPDQIREHAAEICEDIKLLIDMLDMASFSVAGEIKLQESVDEDAKQTSTPQLSEDDRQDAILSSAELGRRLDGDPQPLSKCERAVLSVLTHRRGLTTPVETLSLHCCYRITSSSLRNALGRLRTLGFIDGPNSELRVLIAGMNAGPFEPCPRGAALIAWWLNSGGLNKCERECLDALSKHLLGYSKAELAERTGYSITSSSIRNALGRLRTLGLIVGDYCGSIAMNGALLRDR